MKVSALLFPVILLLPAGCVQPETKARRITPISRPSAEAWHEDRVKAAHARRVEASEIPFRKAGMVNVKAMVPQIRVDLKYSSTDNLAGVDMYGWIENAYLQPEVAEMVFRAWQALQDTLPGYNLLIYDAARPVWVQQIIWDSTDLPLATKTKYLSNPKSHSIHNYGAAIDLTLTTPDGTPLDMGTPYDFFGPEAQPVKEGEMVREGKLTKEQFANRQLLRSIMKKAGFRPFPYEWWHFNACSREEAKRRYTPVF